MKLLYLSCHEVLEYDELRMFANMGFEVLSLGAYLDPVCPSGIGLRPPIHNLTVNADDVAAYQSLAGSAASDARSRLTADFMNRFDAVIVMHMPEWAEACMQAQPRVPVIWRSIGQSGAGIEQRMSRLRDQGMMIVRYSPCERQLLNYCGEDTVIRFGKPATDYDCWTGDTRRAVTFAQNMKGRSAHCRYAVFRDIVAPFDCDLFGPLNESVPHIGRGSVSFEEQHRILRDYRVFVYTGTYPASYTLAFMEAWLAGIPVVAIGRRLWEITPNQAGHLYEVPDLITCGVDGFVSDNISELQACIHDLLHYDSLAATVSAGAVKSASQIFDSRSVQQQWFTLLETL